jgi:hypothetical protein
MSVERVKRFAGSAAKYTIPIVAIAAGLWLIIWAVGRSAQGMRTIALVVFNAPILTISVCLPFVGSLRSALQEKGPSGPIESTSYSRVTGLFGAVIVTAFFWAMGDVILWYIFEAPEKAEAIIDGVWKFFILGAALFLPYAFNQLRAIVIDRQQQTVALERLKLAAGVAIPGSPGTTVLRNKP